jgi:CRISP-associated protein Cas1
MVQVLNTLYVTTPQSYVHLEQENVRVDVNREKLMMVPLHLMGSIVIFGGALVSCSIMQECAKRGIALILLDMNGRFEARVEGSQNGNILLRQAQHKVYDAKEIALEIAKSMVAGKLHNSRYVLLRGARDSVDLEIEQHLRAASKRLANILVQVKEADTINTLMGYEGEAAKHYFTHLNLVVRSECKPAFLMNGRSKRPATDRINALLSLAYALLRNDCRSALEAVGLDPQLGFLHTVRPGRASLALDLMEEFRAIMADRLVLSLINRMQIQENDVEAQAGGGFRLTNKARKAFIIAYQERKKDLVKHSFLVEKVPFGLVPFIQARLLARVIRGDAPHYIPFRLQ